MKYDLHNEGIEAYLLDDDLWEITVSHIIWNH